MERTSIINYSTLFERIGEYARKAGRVTTRPVLVLFYVMKSKNTPWKDKMLILSTLSYLVLPIDILDAKRLPIIGWFDEIASLYVTYQKVSKNIRPIAHFAGWNSPQRSIPTGVLRVSNVSGHISTYENAQ